MKLAVLYDSHCGLCRRAVGWLAAQPKLVPLELVAIGSPEARARFGWMPEADALEKVTVVADTGEVYRGDAAWVTCLWALAGYRSLANSLATPVLRPFARAAVNAAAKLRTRDDTATLGPVAGPICHDHSCGGRL